MQKITGNMCTCKESPASSRILLLFLVLYVSVTALIFTFMALNENAKSKPNSREALQTGTLKHSSTVQREMAKSRILRIVEETKFQLVRSDVWILPPILDMRDSYAPTVRIIAISTVETWKAFSNATFIVTHYKRKALSSFVCEPWYEFSESMGGRFRGFTISCPVRHFSAKHGDGVRVIVGDSGKLAPLHRIPWDTALFNLTLCVPPLQGHLTEGRMIEFLELAKLIGFEHVFFYDFIAQNVQRVLEYYKEKGFISIIPWNNPLEVIASNDLYYRGQVIAVNHCLYTNIGLSKFVSFNDLDEFAIPRKTKSLLHALDLFDETYAGFKIPMAMFNADWKLDATEVRRYKPVVSNFDRTKQVSYLRTKCIVRPEKIFAMGIHHISEFLSSVDTHLDVNTSDILLHHYKACGSDPYSSMDGLECTDTVQDTAMQYFIGMLTYNIRNVSRSLPRSIEQF